MEQYYTVFDATPKEENGKNSLRIGLGLTRKHGFEPEIAFTSDKAEIVEPYSEIGNIQRINERVEEHAPPPIASPFDKRLIILILVSSSLLLLIIVSIAILLYKKKKTPK